ncbi:hypothetical protein GCM10022419_026070 [Nonomuraea rosea]|uniref:Bacterial bifunctional deaminase-reductase C-terminal domain-containing protein n=1 Tax=Nonomuraea rosea TaxID=638574 RepID=A0ABP6W2Z4_9ACTN
MRPMMAVAERSGRYSSTRTSPPSERTSDELGVVVMPILLGDGLRLTPEKSERQPGVEHDVADHHGVDGLLCAHEERVPA